MNKSEGQKWKTESKKNTFTILPLKTHHNIQILSVCVCVQKETNSKVYLMAAVKISLRKVMQKRNQSTYYLA